MQHKPRPLRLRFAGPFSGRHYVSDKTQYHIPVLLNGRYEVLLCKLDQAHTYQGVVQSYSIVEVGEVQSIHRLSSVRVSRKALFTDKVKADKAAFLLNLKNKG